jgi:hypothetical protein
MNHIIHVICRGRAPGLCDRSDNYSWHILAHIAIILGSWQWPVSYCKWLSASPLQEVIAHVSLQCTTFDCTSPDIPFNITITTNSSALTCHGCMACGILRAQIHVPGSSTQEVIYIRHPTLTTARKVSPRGWHL